MSRAFGPRLLVASILIWLAVPLRTLAQQPAPPDEAAELERLLAVMQEETALATQSRLNADYVPGIVTVLHADEMEALGVRSVLEALAFVPGVVAGRDILGRPVLQVRGVDTIFNNGGVRVLVDSRTLSREDSGLGGATLLMPIQQVERIEVIRGPASGVWGNFAFACLVNIVTRADSSGAWAAAGGRDLASAGLRLGPGLLGGPVRVTASLAGHLDSDEPRGSRHAAESHLFGNASLSTGGFALRAAGLSRNRTGFFGNLDRIYEKSLSFEARQALPLTPKARLEAHAGFIQNELQEPSTTYDAHQLDAGLDFTWEVGPHRLLLQGTFARSRIDRASHQPPPPAPRFSLADVDQSLYAVTLQDEARIGSRLTVTGGLRWDHHENIGSRVTPRIAAVARLSKSHTLKAQWAEGFRAPSFFQLYGGGRLRDVGFERIQTAEVGWIYRRETLVGRLTVFRSRYTDILHVRGGFPPALGTSEARASGVELEWTQSLSPRVKAIANVALVDTEDARDVPAGQTRDSFGEARWLWNLALIARLAPGVTAGFHWNHLGDRSGVPGSGTAYEGQELLQLTLGVSPAGIPGLSVRAGVRNALGEPDLFVLRLPGVVQTPDYGGAVLTVQAAYGF